MFKIKGNRIDRSMDIEDENGKSYIIGYFDTDTQAMMGTPGAVEATDMETGEEVQVTDEMYDFFIKNFFKELKPLLPELPKEIYEKKLAELV